MFSLFQKAGKKLGPMKAMNSISTSPVTTTEADRKPLEPLTMSQKQSMSTQDDLSISNPDKPKIKDSSKLVSPFGTIGSMWRPMSMSKSSSIKDHDSEPETRTYNNFDLLRDMSSEKSQTQTSQSQTPKTKNSEPLIIKDSTPLPAPRKIYSLSAGKSRAPTSPSTNTPNNKVPLRNISTPTPTPPVNGELDDSLSEKYFTLLKEEVHEKHADAVRDIVKKTYSVDSFPVANSDTDRLLGELKQTMESLKNSRLDRPNSQFDMCKEELVQQVKSFVQDAKLLVSNATQTKVKMANNLNKSMHTLAKMFLHCQATMIMMLATHQAQHLGFEVIKVTNAYKSTVNAAQAAVGKPLNDPHMKYLMRQATNLASLLSSLLKTLKSLEQK